MPATIYTPDLHWQPTGYPDFPWQVEVPGVYTARIAGYLDAATLYEFTSRGQMLRFAAEAIGYIDHTGALDLVTAVAHVPAQVDGDSVVYDLSGYYRVAYRALGDRLKMTIELRAPLRGPDPLAVNRETALLTVTGGIQIPAGVEVWAGGALQSADCTTYGPLELRDPASGDLLQYLDWVQAQDAAGRVQGGQYRLATDALGARRLYYGLPAAWLDVATYPVTVDPTTVATSTSANATAYSNERKVVRASTGHLYAVFFDGSSAILKYSADNGQSWADMAAGGTIGAYDAGVSIAIDEDDHLHVVGSLGTDLRYRRGVLSGGTSVTWSTEKIITASSVTNPDVIAHREGTGWVAHVVGGYSTADDRDVLYWKVSIAADESISVSSSFFVYTKTVAANVNPYPSISRDASKNLYVSWSGGQTGAGYGIRCRKATYSGGTWSWELEQAIDESNYAATGNISSILDDSGRLIVAYDKSSDGNIAVKRRNADASVSDISPAALAGNALSVTCDAGDAPYLFYVNSGLFYRKYESGAWGSPTQIGADATADQPSARRGSAGSALDVVYRTGSASPFTIAHDRITLNQPPSEPTLSISPAAFDAAAGTGITITHQDPDGDQLGAWALKRVLGSTTQWWNHTTKAFDQTAEHWNAGSGTSVTILAADNAGDWANGNIYSLYAATRDAQGLTGPYNSTAVVANVGAKPVVTISAPGATLAAQQVTVEWTTDVAQGAYQVRLLDAALAQLETTGKITSASARNRTMATSLANDTQYKVEVTVWDQSGGGGVASDPATQTFTTSFTPPLAAADVRVAADADAAKLGLTWARGARILGTFARASTAYKDDGTEVASGAPRYETGQFGQAVLVEEGTTNLLTANQSSVETDTTGFTAQNAATLTRDTTEHWHGSASLKCVTPGAVANEGFLASQSRTVNIGDTYTASVWLKGSGNVYISIYYGGGGANQGDLRGITLTGTWTRYSVTKTAGAAGTQVALYIWTDTSAQAITFYADGLQIEQKAYATSWHLGGGTRAAEVLSLPTAGVITPEGGTWEQWVNVNEVARRQVSGQFNRVFQTSRASGESDDAIRVYHSATSANWVLGTTDDAGSSKSVIVPDSYTPDGWHHFVVTWTVDSAKFYIDGALRGTISAPKLPSGFHSTAFIGCKGSSGSLALNTLHDEVRIYSRALTEEEVADAYNQGTPHTCDQETTLLAHLDGDLEMGNQNASFGDSWRVERRVSGAASWTTLSEADNPASGLIVSYDDRSAASGQAYEHRLVALGNNSTEQAGDAVAASLSITDWFVTHERTAAQVRLRYNWQVSWRRPSRQSRVNPQGSYPIFYGTGPDVAEGTLTCTLTKTAVTTGLAREQLQALLDLIALREPLRLRGPDGENWVVNLQNPGVEVLRDLATTDRALRQVQIQFTEVGPA